MKKLGGTVTNWTLYVQPINTAAAKKRFPEIKTNVVYKLAGTITQTTNPAFKQGTNMTSSIVTRVDRENGIVETVNSIYFVENESTAASATAELGSDYDCTEFKF